MHDLLATGARNNAMTSHDNLSRADMREIASAALSALDALEGP